MERKVLFSPLDSHCINNILKEYYRLLRSNYKEQCKLIANSCNNKLIAYHHSTLINHVEFNHPVCQYINHMMKETSFGGLYSAILTSSYLRKILKDMQFRPGVSHIQVISSLNIVKTFILDTLEKSKRKVDIHGGMLITVVESALKPLYLETIFKNRLSISIVKATLCAADENSKKLGHIIIKTVNGRDCCQSVRGVLYKLESFWVPNLDNSIKSIGNYKILVFTEEIKTISNSDNRDGPNETLFIESVLAANVKIVACQKSINKKLIFLLRRKNIFALERLGEETACALLHMSNAFPISDYARINFEELDNLAGIITKIERICLCDEDYIVIENDTSSVVTLFVSHRSFDSLDQLKIVIKECIHLTYSLFHSPYFLPDGFDCYLAKELRQSNYEVASNLLVKHLMTLFAEVIEDIAEPPSSQIKPISFPKSCDVYLPKRNSLSQTFSSVCNLLQIGLFVIKN